MTENFKQECKNFAYENRLGKIEYGNSESISNSNYLQKIVIDDSCITNGTIVGSIYAKSITFETLKDYELSEKEINTLIGVKYADNSTEYIRMGKYTIQEETSEKTAKMGQYTGLDNLRLLDKEYVCGITDFTNTTIKDFLIDLCNQLNLTLGITSFTNDSIPVKGNPFTNKETCRTVLKAILKCSLNFAVIDVDTESLIMKWVEGEVSETFTKNDYNSLVKNSVYGPINSLIIRDSVISGENVFREDGASIEQNGENQFIIEETYFLYTEELRNQAIDNIWNKIKGFTYIDSTITSSLGKPYLKLGQKISIQDDDGNYFDTYVLKHQFTYDGTFYSVIESPALTKEEETRKNTTDIKTRFRNTERQVDKINGQIIDIIEEQDETITKVNQTISDLLETRNLFQITGGNNLIKNSVGLFDNDYWEQSETGTFEYGADDSLIGITTSMSKISVSNGTLKTTVDNIKGLTLNEIKTLSYKVKQDVDTTTTIKLYGLSEDSPLYTKTFEGAINRWTDVFDENLNSFMPDSSTLILKIESTSTYSGKFYISDFMLNNGDKSEWQMASGESNGTVIKLSQLGIQVYGIEADTLTMMTKQGLQIRSLHGTSLSDIITEFTKNGMITIDIEQSGKHIQKKLVHDYIRSDGHDVYIEYIRE